MIRFINTLSLLTLILLVGCGAATPRVNRGGQIEVSTTTFPNTTVPFSPPGFGCKIIADKPEVVPGMSVKFTVTASGAPIGATYRFDGLRSNFGVNNTLSPEADKLSAVANVTYNTGETGTDIVRATVVNMKDNSSVTCEKSLEVKLQLFYLTYNPLIGPTALNNPNSRIEIIANVLNITNPSFSSRVTDQAGVTDHTILVERSGTVFTARPTDNNVHLNVNITITVSASNIDPIRKTILVSFLPALTTRVDITGDLRVNGLVTFTVIATNGTGEMFSKVELAYSPTIAYVSSTANSVTVRFGNNSKGDYNNLTFTRMTVTSVLRNKTFENGLSSAIFIPAFYINP